MTSDIGQLHPEPSEGEPFIGEHQLEQPPMFRGRASRSDLEVLERVKAAEAERLLAWRWCPAMPPAFSVEWQRIEAARMGMVVVGDLQFGRKKR